MSLEVTLRHVHELLAKDMLDRLQNGVPATDKSGVPLVDPETGEPILRPLVAAEWTAIAKFLKDNGIDAAPPSNPATDDAFTRLIESAQKSVPSYNS